MNGNNEPAPTLDDLVQAAPNRSDLSTLERTVELFLNNRQAALSRRLSRARRDGADVHAAQEHLREASQAALQARQALQAKRYTDVELTVAKVQHHYDEAESALDDALHLLCDKRNRQRWQVIFALALALIGLFGALADGLLTKFLIR